jgi:hypothetical protein
MLVIDNYIKDKDLLGQIRADKTFFPESMGSDERIADQLNSYHYEKSSCYAPYMFWDGWWRSEADTLKKKVVQKIWENNLDYPVEDILGIEYWTRTFEPGQYLDHHVDEDTFLYEKEKVFTGPICGSVYYFGDNLEGGFLEIHNKSIKEKTQNALERDNIEQYIVNIEERERIAYKDNRLIIFDSGHIIHNATAAKSGVRQVMVTNVWHKDNPPLALELGTFYYE